MTLDPMPTQELLRLQNCTSYCRSTNFRALLMFANFTVWSKTQTLIAREHFLQLLYSIYGLPKSQTLIAGEMLWFAETRTFIAANISWSAVNHFWNLTGITFGVLSGIVHIADLIILTLFILSCIITACNMSRFMYALLIRCDLIPERSIFVVCIYLGTAVIKSSSVKSKILFFWAYLLT